MLENIVASERLAAPTSATHMIRGPHQAAGELDPESTGRHETERHGSWA